MKNESSVLERPSAKAFSLSKETLRTLNNTVRGVGRGPGKQDSASCDPSTGTTCTSFGCCCCAELAN